ncbi:hypothetical protein ACIOWI_33055 [Streptomyces sp. NPDC087659]|uniref:hypothetical protein n=1 Tax=Streptomyces sp. NPDC087659 TaxID=3365801 RepID=UPI0038027A9E
MSIPTAGSGPYNWAADDDAFVPPQAQPSRAAGARSSDPFDVWRHDARAAGSEPQEPRQAGSSRHTHRERTYNINVGGGGGGRGSSDHGSPAAGADRHQGDRLIHAVERIEIRSDKDILALAKAINHLGRELHLILGMRAEEINGVLSTYKGKWYTFGASSRVKARLVSAHLKVSAEAAKALGVGALKMAHAFDRHFVKPEQEAKQRRNGKTTRRQFTIGDA